jgi:hypothetical protein
VLLVQAFAGPIRRASLGGVIGGMVAGAVVMYGLAAAPWLVAALVAIAATVGVGLAVNFVLLTTRVRRAFEAFSWLGAREVDRLRERAGSPPPTSAAEVAAWLEANPAGPITREARIEMLLSLGRIDEGRAELEALAALPAGRTDLARLELAGSRAYAEILETGTYDAAALDAALATLPRGSDLELEGRAARAATETRGRLARGEPDALTPLAAVRPALGRAAAAVTFRRTWLTFARSLAVFGIAVAFAGYVLRLVG